MHATHSQVVRGGGGGILDTDKESAQVIKHKDELLAAGESGQRCTGVFVLSLQLLCKCRRQRQPCWAAWALVGRGPSPGAAASAEAESAQERVHRRPLARPLKERPHGGSSWVVLQTPTPGAAGSHTLSSSQARLPRRAACVEIGVLKPIPSTFGELVCGPAGGTASWLCQP